MTVTVQSETPLVDLNERMDTMASRLWGWTLVALLMGALSCVGLVLHLLVT